MNYPCKLLGFWNLLVDFLGEVLVRLQDLAVRHGCGNRIEDGGMIVILGSTCIMEEIGGKGGGW